MKRLDAKKLGRLAVAVRSDRELKAAIEGEIAGLQARHDVVTQRLAEREPLLAAALGEPPIGPAPAR